MQAESDPSSSAAEEPGLGLSSADQAEERSSSCLAMEKDSCDSMDGINAATSALGLKDVSKQFSEERLEEIIRTISDSIFVAEYKNNLVGVLEIHDDKACPIGDLIAPELNKIYLMQTWPISTTWAEKRARYIFMEGRGRPDQKRAALQAAWPSSEAHVPPRWW